MIKPGFVYPVSCLLFSSYGLLNMNRKSFTPTPFAHSLDHGQNLVFEAVLAQKALGLLVFPGIPQGVPVLQFVVDGYQQQVGDMQTYDINLIVQCNHCMIYTKLRTDTGGRSVIRAIPVLCGYLSYFM